MDIKLLKKTLRDLDELYTNEFSLDLPMDNMDQVKESLSNLNLKFKI